MYSQVDHQNRRKGTCFWSCDLDDRLYNTSGPGQEDGHDKNHAKQILYGKVLLTVLWHQSWTLQAPTSGWACWRWTSSCCPKEPYGPQIKGVYDEFTSRWTMLYSLSRFEYLDVVFPPATKYSSLMYFALATHVVNKPCSLTFTLMPPENLIEAIKPKITLFVMDLVAASHVYKAQKQNSLGVLL